MPRRRHAHSHSCGSSYCPCPHVSSSPCLNGGTTFSTPHSRGQEEGHPLIPVREWDTRGRGLCGAPMFRAALRWGQCPHVYKTGAGRESGSGFCTCCPVRLSKGWVPKKRGGAYLLGTALHSLFEHKGFHRSENWAITWRKQSTVRKGWRGTIQLSCLGKYEKNDAPSDCTR